MTDSTLGSCSPKDEPSPCGWVVLLALLAGWGITLRLLLLVCIPVAVVAVVVALIVIYLGPIGATAVLWRFLARRRSIRALPRPHPGGVS